MIHLYMKKLGKIDSVGHLVVSRGVHRDTTSAGTSQRWAIEFTVNEFGARGPASSPVVRQDFENVHHCQQGGHDHPNNHGKEYEATRETSKALPPVFVMSSLRHNCTVYRGCLCSPRNVDARAPSQ